MLNSDVVIENHFIGVPSASSGLDGHLGVGRIDLTKDTDSNANEVPTLTDNLYAQNAFGSEVLGVFFAPASSGDRTGELTFGSYDASAMCRSHQFYSECILGY
jgi:hypothetical protein